jgi:L-2-hydroxyglutarate oxidase LhgO
MDSVDAIVVGAGVVGLACARALVLDGMDVLVVESEDRIGTGVSSRNSEVIHAGLYFKSTTLKTQLCVRGRKLLYDYCAARGVGHSRCGKYVVATDESQLEKLQGILAQALANGVDDAHMIDADVAMRNEPLLSCVGALASPSTGIIDVHELMLAYHGDIENAGGMVVCNSRFASARPQDGGFVVRVEGADPVWTRRLVNAAGLGAQDVARGIEGLAPTLIPKLYYGRGQYFAIAGRTPFSRLIYPIPFHGGLGIHFTLDLAGRGKVGPDVQWVDAPGYEVDGSREQLFRDSVRTYLPSLADDALMPAYVGIRPKLHAANEPQPDFRISGPEEHGMAGLVNLFGIESPGVTSSLAIADFVLERSGAELAAR